MNNFCQACLEEKKNMLSAVRSDYSPAKCSKCGLVQTNPMPSNETLLSYYQGFSFQKPSLTEIERDLDAISRSLKFLVGRPCGGKRFLDYGGGCGIYAKAALKLGWNTELFDYDKDMVAYGREALGLPYVYDSLDACKGPYDIIFAFHVVEHWNDVDAHFKTLLERLAPGGRIVLATPNARSIEKWFRPKHFVKYFRLWKTYVPNRWKRLLLLLKPNSVFCWDPPRHLLAWTPCSFKALGERYGLETKITVGYNGDPLFEPRNYVLKPLKAKIAEVRRQNTSTFSKALRILWEILEKPGLAVCRRLFPGLGEHLYVELSRKI